MWPKNDELCFFVAFHLGLSLSSFQLTWVIKRERERERDLGSSIYLKVDTDHKGVQPPQKKTKKQVPEICCTPQCLQLIIRYSAPKKFIMCRSHIECFHQQKAVGREERIQGNS